MIMKGEDIVRIAFADNAKRHAILFVDWIRKNNWSETSGITPTLWANNVTGQLKTTEQLYKMFTDDTVK